MPLIKIALADDQVLFLKGLRMIISSFNNMEIIIEAKNGLELLEAVRVRQPDVILMDLKMPELDGVEATKLVKQEFPGVKVLLLTMYDDHQLVNHLMKIGANGYLLKNEDPKILREAIESVFEKDYYFSEFVSTALLKGLSNGENSGIEHDGSADPVKYDLSRREVEVLKLICEEMTTPEIARKLFISTRTVDGHRKNLLEKTGARNTAGLIIYAVKYRLISLDA